MLFFPNSRIISIFAPMFQIEDFIVDLVYGERLLISKQADPSELDENIRVARVLLSCFDDMKIRINEHLLVFGHKNPEYTINEKLGDRKGVESENGIKSIQTFLHSARVFKKKVLFRFYLTNLPFLFNPLLSTLSTKYTPEAHSETSKRTSENPPTGTVLMSCPKVS